MYGGDGVKATEVLMHEHEAIKEMLEVVGRVCDRLESGRQVPVEHLEQIIEFLRVFADRCHHGKEQDLLFPAMQEAGIPAQGGPIGVMLAEHDMGRGFIAGMAEATERYRKNAAAAPAIGRNARAYISLLTDHIFKEDNILYPMADARLSEKKQQELVAEFERVEREEIGPGKHEEFHHLIHRLSEAYP